MEQEAYLVVFFTTGAIIFIILLGFVVLFTLFQKTKTRLILEQIQKEEFYKETLQKSELEIKEHTLKNIAWELHDNIGQLLSLARLELNILLQNTLENKDKIKEISDLIGNTLQEIRAISKTLNAEVISNIGLIESISIEINRFNRLNFIKSDMHIIGEPFIIVKEDEIILFRMVQEFLSNIIKHSKATRLKINLNFHDNLLELSIVDNGQGFDIQSVEKGSGLINMKSRAAMIGVELAISSNAKGTQVNLKYQNKNEST